MPSKISNLLNKKVFTGLTAAEINAGVPFPHVGVGLQNLGNQRVLITGLLWSVQLGAPADKPNLIISILCERGLTLTGVLTTLNQEEDIFGFALDGAQPATVFDGFIGFTSPVILDAGFNYGIILLVSQRALIGGDANVTLTVFGTQISADGTQQIPYILR